jgi:hypothetical protein
LAIFGVALEFSAKLMGGEAFCGDLSPMREGSKCFSRGFMPMKFCVRILSLAALLCLSTQARADLTGDTINFGEYDGVDNSAFAFSLGTIPVPGSVDNFGFTTTITGNTITITEDPATGTTCNTLPAGTPGLVCGLVFTDVTRDPGITGISLDPASTASTLTPSFSGSNIYLDFTNLTLNGGEVETFDLTFSGGNNVAATPEPGSLMLLGTGVLGVVGTLRKRVSVR